MAIITQSAYLESVNDAIKVKQRQGNKAHIWLTAIETKRLLNAATSKRDKLILALLVGAGLRRDELVNLKYSARFISSQKQLDKLFRPKVENREKTR